MAALVYLAASILGHCARLGVRKQVSKVLGFHMAQDWVFELCFDNSLLRFKLQNKAIGVQLLTLCQSISTVPTIYFLL